MTIIRRNNDKRSLSISANLSNPNYKDDITKISDSVPKQTTALKKPIPEQRSPESLLSSGDHLQRATHQPRLTIPSYGYIPNSVVRKKTQPPSAPTDVMANIWKNMTLEEAEEHWFKFDNFDDDVIWMPDEETSESESDHSDSAVTSSFRGQLSNYELLKQYYEDQRDGESITKDDNKIPDEDKVNSAANSNDYTIEFDNENGPPRHIDAQKLINAMSVKDRERYEKYFEQKRDRSSSVRLSFRKLGNTLLAEDAAANNTSTRKNKGERVLKFRPVAKAVYAAQHHRKDGHDNQSDGTTTKLSGDSSTHSSSTSAKSDPEDDDAKTNQGREKQLRRRSSVSVHRTSSDLKAKLFQQRTEAKELAQTKANIALHPLLQV